MPMTCKVCRHPERPAIDRSLLGGEAYRDLASRYVTLSAMALLRHKADHLPALLAKAKGAEEAAAADTLLAELKALRGKAVSLLLAAEAAGDLRTALLGVREARACLEVLAEVEGKLDRRPTVNLVLSPEWITLRTTILVALTPHPGAKAAVSEALASLGA